MPPSDLFSRGMAWLARKERTHCARPVVYEWASGDGETRFLPVPAVLGRPGATGEATVEPLRIDTGDLDFLIAAADLRVDGEPIEPAADDRIRYETGGRTYRYEVLPHGSGPPWRWSDPQKNILRIHARLVEDYPTPEG